MGSKKRSNSTSSRRNGESISGKVFFIFLFSGFRQLDIDDGFYWRE